MKKIFLLLTLLLPTLLSAQDTTTDQVTINAVTLQPGGDEAEVTVSLNGTEHLYTGFEMDIILPEGIVLTYDEDNELNLWLETGSTLYTMKKGVCSHSIDATYNEVGESVVRISCLSLSNTVFKQKSGALFVMCLKANDSATSGAVPLALSNCKFITYDSGTASTIGYQVTQTEISGITIDTSASITSLNIQDKALRSIVNLNGQRVSEQHPGNIYIVNGKKQVCQ